jgi:serine protease
MEDSENYGTYYHPSHGGDDVYSYIVDTGILLRHVEFEGRATFGANYAGGVNDDCNGHGTHVAGTVGGATYGIARKVNLVSVKVLNCQGSGTNAGVISGVNFVSTNCGNRKCTANMSLGGGYSAALNNAVGAAVDNGIPFAVAAGNENQNACNVSPASEPKAITVGSTAQQAVGGSESQIDVRSSFSNFGTCVDVFAPGSSIRSAWIDSTGAGRLDRVNTISGTSMASPHVCGVASLLLQDNPNASPAQIVKLITDRASAGVITLNCGSSAICNASPNLLLFTDC